MGYSIAIPKEVLAIQKVEDRILTLRFDYKKSGEQVVVYHKWCTEQQFNEQAVQANKPI